MTTLQEQLEKIVIYGRTCNINAKVYVGSTSGDAKKSATELAEARFKRHCSNAKAKKKSKNFYYFQSAIQKYGSENFSLEILYEGFGTEAEKLAMEQKFLDELPRNEKGLLDSTRCYNLSPVAGGGKVLENYSKHKSVSSKALHETKILEFPKLANFSPRDVQAFCSHGKIQQIEIREAQTNLVIMICSSSRDVQEKLGTASSTVRAQLRDPNFRQSGTLPAPLLGHKVRITVKLLPPLNGEDLK